MKQIQRLFQVLISISKIIFLEFQTNVEFTQFNANLTTESSQEKQFLNQTSDQHLRPTENNCYSELGQKMAGLSTLLKLS